MSIETKLNHTNTNEEIIANHLKQRIKEDEQLRVAIENANTNIEECWNYVIEEARKLLNGKSGALEDSVVFEIAERYFKEYKEPEKNNIKTKKSTKKSTKKEVNTTKVEIKEEKTEKIESENNKSTTSIKISKVGNQFTFDI